MHLPILVPYIEIVYILITVGIIAVAGSSAGALLRAWSWKVPRTMAYAFFGVVFVLILVSWLFNTLAS